MKKLILAVACLSLGLSAAFANPANDSKKDQKECDKKECKACNSFDGLNLTDAQKQQLEALCPFGQGKEKKEGDKTQTPPQRRKFSPEQADSMRRAMMEKRLDSRKNYLAKVKEILTPEQYTQFLENNFINAMPQMPDRNGDMQPGQRPGDKGKQGAPDRRKQRHDGRPSAQRN